MASDAGGSDDGSFDGAAAPEPHPDAAAPSRWTERRFEMIAVVLLGLTALATAWSGYQASIWSGIQSSSYTQASSARTNAAQARTAANQYRIADLTAFTNYVDAYIDGNDDVAMFYERRFRPEFAIAFEAWRELDPLDNPDAPATPLAMPEYRLASDQEAVELEARADRLFQRGEDANRNSDVYTLTTLLFAAVLFFAAISERFEFVPARLTLLVLGAVGLIVGIVIAATLPITTG